MALTAEDVVNKRFQSTKFREGYDQDEVDDFLDEVVVEMRRLAAENATLQSQLAEATAMVNAATSAAPAAAAAVIAQPATGSIPTLGEEDESGSTNLLVLARRLHEEHVREGVEKREALIAEGRAEAARLLSEAEATKADLVAKSEGELAELQDRVDTLRAFEADYRTRLKDYIQQQLNSLNSPIVSD